MRNMRKLIALLLAACMLMLTGCSQTGPAQTEAPTKAPAEATKAPETSAPTSGAETPTDAPDDGALDTSWILEDTNMSGTVNFWIPFKGTQGMDALIAEFNSVYPNITVNLNSYSNGADGNVGVNTAILAGEVDVLASFGLGNTNNRWENGLFVDITDKVEEEGIDLVEQWGTDVYKYDGSIYTFPCGGLSNYICINMTAWNEAGLGELPKEWTWDEYLEASKAMTKVAADGKVEIYGGSDVQDYSYFMYTISQGSGKDRLYDEDGTSSYDNPRALKALERKLKAELEDKIWYPNASYKSDGYYTNEAFLAGKIASGITTNIVRFLHQTETYPDVKWVTGFAPYPVEEEGETNYMSGVSTFSHAGIALNCQDEDAAWAFLKWYSTYGVKYLVAAGHQPKWIGTEPGAALALIYGSEEEAAKWVDFESFSHVIGRTDLPAYADTNLTALADVGSALKDPIMQAISGEMSAEDCLKQAAEEADEAIRDAQ
ncbi:MAG: extracellular solute-binding protein [Lachnospiraceae bacterium]|nr:extracellular solute-binding protein [Lachnospiraceae bacterium]